MVIRLYPRPAYIRNIYDDFGRGDKNATKANYVPDVDRTYAVLCHTAFKWRRPHRRKDILYGLAVLCHIGCRGQSGGAHEAGTGSQEKPAEKKGAQKETVIFSIMK